MDRRASCSKCFRNSEICQIAAELDAGFGDRLAGFSGVSHPVDAGGEPQRNHRLDQILTQFRGSLAIAPIADPDEIVLLVDFTLWPENTQIGAFVPGEGPSCPTAPLVSLAQNLAKGEDTVETVEVHGPDRIGFARHAVMRVMEQQQVRAAGASVRSNPRDEFRR